MPPWIKSIREARECREMPLFCVHYASHIDPVTHSPKVNALAVHVLGFDQTKVFSMGLMAEREGLSIHDIPHRQLELERLLFDEFHCYLNRMQAKYPAAWWFHWAMRDASFGWPVLEHRSLALLKRSLPITEDQQVDLHAWLTNEYGRDFVPRPQLLHLAELNGLNTVNVVAGTQEMQLSVCGDDEVVRRSTAKKAELIGHLLVRYAQGKLVIGTGIKRQRQRSWPLCADASLTRELLNAVQASRICGISRATWYRLMAEARVPVPLKIGRRSLWDARELRLWIEAKCPPMKAWQMERKLVGLSPPARDIRGDPAG